MHTFHTSNNDTFNTQQFCIRRKGEEQKIETLCEEIGLNSSFECSDVIAVSNTVWERVPKLRTIDREKEKE